VCNLGSELGVVSFSYNLGSELGVQSGRCVVYNLGEVLLIWTASVHTWEHFQHASNKIFGMKYA
jgi:hypothetical protein